MCGVVSKLHKLVSSCYSCLLALTPYDLNVFNKFLKKMQWKEEKKKLNNNPKMKNLKFLTCKRHNALTWKNPWIDIKQYDLNF
jgi:DNA topoisomerase VI subunit A